MPLLTFQPRHLLSAVIFTAVLMIGVRMNDLLDSFLSGKAFETVSSAQATTGKEVPEINAPSLSPPQAANKENQDAGAVSAPSSPPAISVQPELKTLPVPTISADQSGAEMALIKQLAERRDQLEQRAQALDSREAILKVAEQRVDQKIKEMETLRAQLQTMINQLNTTQQAQIDNLVKIYETMKPKEAARILETMEIQLLLGVIQKMKPQRVAAVMAEMKPEKAKEITVALTKQDQLPQIK